MVIHAQRQPRPDCGNQERAPDHDYHTNRLQRKLPCRFELFTHHVYEIQRRIGDTGVNSGLYHPQDLITDPYGVAHPFTGRYRNRRLSFCGTVVVSLMI